MTVVNKGEQQDLFVNFFMAQEKLSGPQVEQFLLYRSLLIEWNEYFNLTAIVEPNRIIVDHFQDSLILRRFFDLALLRGVGDVGAGAGFPGIPLAIVTEIPFFLIEVNGKKRCFLEKVVSALGLKNVFISAFDWRTFIRKTDFPIDLFCARASLRPDELVRQFAPDSHYRNGGFVYFASESWKKSDYPEFSRYYCNEYSYMNGDKNRKLICMKRVVGSG